MLSRIRSELQAAITGPWPSCQKTAQRITWNSMGASGQAAGELHSVALFRMAVSKPPIASTLPAGTSCSAVRRHRGYHDEANTAA